MSNPKWLGVIASYSMFISLSCGTKKDVTSTEPSTNCDIGSNCFVRDPRLDVPNISLTGLNISHNPGKNCMECHQKFGPGKGRYTIAGTLFSHRTQSWNQVSVKVFKDAAHTQEVLSVPVDILGNFYTTESLNIPDSGYFVSIVDDKGQMQKNMPFSTLSLACNICHAGNSRLTVTE